MIAAGAIAPANADGAGELVWSEEEEGQSRAFMSEWGVPTEVQDELLDRLADGNTGLANDPAAVPTSVETVDRDGAGFEVRQSLAHAHPER